jgi:hypothetical protein
MPMPDENDSLDFSDHDGPVMGVACGKCRKVAFSPTPETAVQSATEHAVYCGSSDMVIVELLASREYYAGRRAHN